MSRRFYGYLVAPAAAAVAAFVACSDPGIVRAPSDSSVLARAGSESSAILEDALTHVQYGPAEQVGNGIVRTYVVTDKSNKDVPLEIGVAMSESAMEGLPAPVAMPAMTMPADASKNPHQHEGSTVHLLTMPSQNPTPYQFVELDWNPGGHEPAGVYDIPHFDFHFYVVSREVRASIVPTDPQYAQQAASLPGAEFRAPFYIDAATAAGAPAGAVAVPQMGLHWLDVRSPELQRMTGHPEAFKPFTKTFIYGSWNGQFIFDEPMITRAYIMAKRDASDPAVRNEIVPVPTAQRYSPAGFYPSAYRIAYDARAREYRIALTQLSARQ